LTPELSPSPSPSRSPISPVALSFLVGCSKASNHVIRYQDLRGCAPDRLRESLRPSDPGMHVDRTSRAHDLITLKHTTAAPGVAIPATPGEPGLSGPLKDLFTHLPAIISSTNHSEIWGVELTDPSTSIPTQIILQKYLNANDQDVSRAKDQLTRSLTWRAKIKPLELTKAKYSKEKFGGLGYVTVYEGGVEKSTEPEAKEIFTWYVTLSSHRLQNSHLESDNSSLPGTSMAASLQSTAPSVWWKTSLPGVSR
jgi:hypothetical protein